MTERNDEPGGERAEPGLLDRILAAARRGLDPKGGWILPDDSDDGGRTGDDGTDSDRDGGALPGSDDPDDDEE